MRSTIIEALHRVCGRATTENPIALHEPDFNGTQAWPYVRDCLDTGWVSSSGQWVNRFEQELCDRTGATHAVAVSNGTVALRLALHIVGVAPGDEVLIPPLSFVATANAVVHLGATPHFVDIERGCLGMDPEALSARLEAVGDRRNGEVFNMVSGRRIAAIIPVHVFGHPARVVELKAIADDWGLPLVEDAAEALGSWRNGTHCGLFGDVSTLSFNGNKVITTGGGGALITHSDKLAQRARHLSSTAKIPHRWAFNHDFVGWNDRLPNINAALGVAQMEDLNRRLQAKRQLAELYRKAFAHVESVELVSEPAGCSSNHWLVSLRFLASDPVEAETQRLEVLKAGHSEGFLLRPVWRPLHTLPMYTEAPRGQLPETENQSCRLLNLPSSPQLVFGRSA